MYLYDIYIVYMTTISRENFYATNTKIFKQTQRDQNGHGVVVLQW